MTEDICSFYGLSKPAFGPITGPDQIFRCRLVAPVSKELLAGAHVLAIRGNSGTGKTAFMHVLAMDLHAHGLTVSVIDRTAPSPAELQVLILHAAGLDGAELAPEALLRAIWEAGQRRLIVLCDNAETLSAPAFHYLSTLVQLRFSQPLRVQLLLLGKLEDWPGLAGPELEPLQQAAASRFVTFSFRKDETEAYLDHRLRQAGRPLRQVMTSSAVGALRDLAHGNPRRLDDLAQRALAYGFQAKRRRLTARTVRRALAPEWSPRGRAETRPRTAHRLGRRFVGRGRCRCPRLVRS